MEKLFSENIAAPLVRRLRDHCDCFALSRGSETPSRALPGQLTPS
jgi:hypothetical protein